MRPSSSSMSSRHKSNDRSLCALVSSSDDLRRRTSRRRSLKVTVSSSQRGSSSELRPSILARNLANLSPVDVPSACLALSRSLAVIHDTQQAGLGGCQAFRTSLQIRYILSD